MSTGFFFFTLNIVAYRAEYFLGLVIQKIWQAASKSFLMIRLWQFVELKRKTDKKRILDR